MATSATPRVAPEPVKPDDVVEVGRVVGAWGIRGALKVKPLASDPQALFSSRRWFIEPSELHPGRSLPLDVLRIREVREQGDMIVASAHDVDDRNVAEALKGARVFISRASFPTPDDDEFYWVDLIGLNVSNRLGHGLGSVVGLIETGPHCVLRVQPTDPDQEEVLIPFVGAYVDSVDINDRQIVVDWHADY